MAHLPAMALFFAHDAQQAHPVVVTGSRIDELALLLRRSEFSVALIKDQVQQRVAHVLRRNVENFFKFLPTLEFAEFDLRARSLTVDRVELIVFYERRIKANVLLPRIKKDPSNHRRSQSFAP